MRILWSPGGLDIEERPYPEIDAAIDTLCASGSRLTYSIEGFQHTAKKGEHDTAIVGCWEESHFLPCWEKYFDTCIIIFPLKVEMRYYEDLGESKYAIHTEPFPSPLGNKINEELFFTGFFRSLAIDPVDLRKAVRMGIKMTTPASVVQ